MKFKFFCSTIVATTTFAISTLSFFSINPAMAVTKVNAVGRCDVFNDAGKVIGKTIPGRNYQLVRHMRFRNGLHGAKIVGKYISSNRESLFTANVLNGCFKTFNNRVVNYN